MTVRPGIMVEQGIIEFVIARYDITGNLQPDRVISDLIKSSPTRSGISYP